MQIRSVYASAVFELLLTAATLNNITAIAIVIMFIIVLAVSFGCNVENSGKKSIEILVFSILSILTLVFFDINFGEIKPSYLLLSWFASLCILLGRRKNQLGENEKV